ncbi:hypothetical protein N8705_00115 [Gammaproteobacteria bacterium]|jgi:hypothetical protein|nr:hypothetical protein [Gammaproteobacteria bacterium]
MSPQQKYFYSIFRYRSLDKIIFNDTVLGELISFYYRYFTNNPNTKHFGRMIASREMLKKSTGNWAITKEGTFSKKP